MSHSLSLSLLRIMSEREIFVTEVSSFLVSLPLSLSASSEKVNEEAASDGWRGRTGARLLQQRESMCMMHESLAAGVTSPTK